MGTCEIVFSSPEELRWMQLLFYLSFSGAFPPLPRRCSIESVSYFRFISFSLSLRKINALIIKCSESYFLIILTTNSLLLNSHLKASMRSLVGMVLGIKESKLCLSHFLYFYFLCWIEKSQKNGKK